MTRVNLVPPEELADQHLFAEFRELKMVPKSLARSIAARGVGAVVQRIPGEYVLGTGHVSFFYDKGLFLLQRYSRLRHELRYRGVQFNEAALLDPDNVFQAEPWLCRDYCPTPEAIALNRARIAERIAQKPEWYRWTKRR